MKCRAADLPVYPFMVASLPLVDFYLGNFRVLGWTDGLRLLSVYFLITAVALIVGRLVWRQTARAALVVAPVLLVVFWGGKLAGPASLLILTGSAALGWVIHRHLFDARRWNLPLNMAVLVFLVVPVARIVRAEWRNQPPTPTALAQEVPRLNVQPGTTPPDIYFLLVDGLGQPDFLREHYGLADADFRQVLARRGFQVLPQSHSVYPQTALSVASTLEMGFLQDLLEIPDTKNMDRRVLARMVGRSRVSAALRGAGYAVRTFPSGYPVTRMAQVDRRWEPTWNISFLEYYVLDQSALGLVGRVLGGGPSDLLYEVRRQRLNYTFSRLPRARTGLPDDRPLFVFAHILAPHPPFVFNRDGSPRNPDVRFGFADGSHWRAAHGGHAADYRAAYAGQAAYVLQRLGAAVDEIVARSPRPPVIIIQGDHGPGSELEWEDPAATNVAERFGIGNAWLVPPGMDLALGPDESAVNTFVRLFNGVFDAQLTLLPRRQWFATSSHPFAFAEVDTLNPR